VTKAAPAFSEKAACTVVAGTVNFRSFQNEIEQEVRANPVEAIFSVLGIGFLLGVIFSALNWLNGWHRGHCPSDPYLLLHNRTGN
jgi:hypothetical protein